MTVIIILVSNFNFVLLVQVLNECRLFIQEKRKICNRNTDYWIILNTQTDIIINFLFSCISVWIKQIVMVRKTYTQNFIASIEQIKVRTAPF